MYISFEEMPKDARIWIYQADRSLTDVEVEAIQKDVISFLEQWSAHGAGLKCSGKLIHNRFLLISVDEKHHGASGCSIDSSVHFIKAMGAHLNVNWFDRANVAFKKQEEVVVTKQLEIKETIAKGEISEDTLTFNNLVSTIDEFESNWVVPAKNTWLKRYFK